MSKTQSLNSSLNPVRTGAETSLEQAREAVRCVLALTKERGDLEEQRKVLDERIVNALMNACEGLGVTTVRSEYVEVDAQVYRCWMEAGRPRLESITIKGRK
jgi:hypothetical protein